MEVEYIISGLVLIIIILGYCLADAFAKKSELKSEISKYSIVHQLIVNNCDHQDLEILSKYPGILKEILKSKYSRSVKYPYLFTYEERIKKFLWTLTPRNSNIINAYLKRIFPNKTNEQRNEVLIEKITSGKIDAFYKEIDDFLGVADGLFFHDLYETAFPEK